jgi:hypothetical protein
MRKGRPFQPESEVPRLLIPIVHIFTIYLIYCLYLTNIRWFRYAMYRFRALSLIDTNTDSDLLECLLYRANSPCICTLMAGL